jgi:hypothetical protein
MIPTEVPTQDQGVAQASPDVNAYVLEHGRLPRLGEAVPPWEYRGWLLYYVQLADLRLSSSSRWSHYMRTLEAGHLLDDPIPEIRFTDCPPPDGRRMLEDCLDLVERKEYTWQAFTQFLDWLSWGFALSREMPKFGAQTNEALYRTFNLGPLLLHPHDYLGTILSDRRSGGWNPHAFYPTPHNIVEMMVQMTFCSSPSTHGNGNEATDPRLRTCCDPAVGTGRMLLHASNYTYCLYGCDIDPVVLAICRLNAACYAPWMAFPFSEKILGRPLPLPPPASLPIPKEHLRPGNAPSIRVDDRGQGLLF